MQRRNAHDRALFRASVIRAKRLHPYINPIDDGYWADDDEPSSPEQSQQQVPSLLQGRRRRQHHLPPVRPIEGTVRDTNRADGLEDEVGLSNERQFLLTVQEIRKDDHHSYWEWMGEATKHTFQLMLDSALETPVALKPRPPTPTPTVSLWGHPTQQSPNTDLILPCHPYPCPPTIRLGPLPCAWPTVPVFTTRPSSPIASSTILSTTLPLKGHHRTNPRTASSMPASPLSSPPPSQVDKCLTSIQGKRIIHACQSAPPQKLTPSNTALLAPPTIPSTTTSRGPRPSRVSSLQAGPILLVSDIPLLSFALPLGHIAALTSTRDELYELRAW